MNRSMRLGRVSCVLVLMAIATALGGSGGCKKKPAATITANVPANWVDHTVPGEKVTFRAPAGWQKSDAAHGTAYMLQIDGKGSNVNLVVQPRQSGMSIEDAPKQVPEMLAKAAPSFKLVAADIVEVAGERAARVDYEMAMNGVPLRATQYILLSSSTACFVTYTAGAANHAAYAKDIEQVAASVKMP